MFKNCHEANCKLLNLNCPSGDKQWIQTHSQFVKYHVRYDELLTFLLAMLVSSDSLDFQLSSVGVIHSNKNLFHFLHGGLASGRFSKRTEE